MNTYVFLPFKLFSVILCQEIFIYDKQECINGFWHSEKNLGTRFAPPLLISFKVKKSEFDVDLDYV